MARKKSKRVPYVGSLIWILNLLPGERESLVKYLQTISQLEKIPESQKEKIKTVLIPLLKSGQVPRDSGFIDAMSKCKMHPISAAKEIGTFYKFRQDSRQT